MARDRVHRGDEPRVDGRCLGRRGLGRHGQGSEGKDDGGSGQGVERGGTRRASGHLPVNAQAGRRALGGRTGRESVAWRPAAVAVSPFLLLTS